MATTVRNLLLNRIRFTKTSIIFWELVGVLLLHVGEIVARFPCNHADALYFSYRDCIFALAVFEVIRSFIKREICLSFWALLGLMILLPMIEDRFNIMIHYDTWISRGMPDFGTMQH